MDLQKGVFWDDTNVVLSWKRCDYQCVCLERGKFKCISTHTIYCQDDKTFVSLLRFWSNKSLTKMAHGLTYFYTPIQNLSTLKKNKDNKKNSKNKKQTKKEKKDGTVLWSSLMQEKTPLSAAQCNGQHISISTMENVGSNPTVATNFQFSENQGIIYMAKVSKKNTIRMGNKVVSYDVPLFAPSGHIVYSGFGTHVNKARKAERRNRKLEEKRVMRGDW